MWPFKRNEKVTNQTRLESAPTKESIANFHELLNNTFKDDAYTNEHVTYLVYTSALAGWSKVTPDFISHCMYEAGFERIATWNKEENKPNPVIWRRKKKDVSEAMHYEVDQYTGDDYLCGSRTNDRLIH